MQDAESIIELVGEIWSKAESQKCFQSLDSASALGFHQALHCKQSSQLELLEISRFSVFIISVYSCSSSFGCISKQHLFDKILTILAQQKL